MTHDLQIVDIMICNNLYKVACKKNEEHHLLELADKFTELVNSIVNSNNSKSNDAAIFLLAGLTLADKIEELKKEVKTLTDEMLLYQPYFDYYSQLTNSIKEILSYSIFRIEKLIQHLKNS